MKAAAATNIGGSRNKENQDAFFIKGHTVGVFDGHGTGGKVAAEKARDVFVAAVAAVAAVEVADVFAVADAAVSAAVSNHSGTTATLLQVAADGACTVSHVGDSEAFVFDSDEGTGALLGADHSPCSLEEWTRVRARHPRTVFRFAPPSGGLGVPVFVPVADGTFIQNPTGGYSFCNVRRDWAAYVCNDSGDKLGVTRALGDGNMKPSGVICSPSIVTKEAPAPGTVRAVVIASDGLWDAMLPEEVRAIVRKPEFLATQDADAAIAALMAAALAKGAELFGTDYDNVTAVVVYVTASSTESETPTPTPTPTEPM